MAENKIGAMTTACYAALEAVINGHQAMQCKEQALEIEQLRGAAERAARTENERSQRAVEMENEIERLRGLLRRVLDCGADERTAEYDLVRIPHELDKAIEEALSNG